MNVMDFLNSNFAQWFFPSAIIASVSFIITKAIQRYQMRKQVVEGTRSTEIELQYRFTCIDNIIQEKELTYVALSDCKKILMETGEVVPEYLDDSYKDISTKVLLIKYLYLITKDSDDQIGKVIDKVVNTCREIDEFRAGKPKTHEPASIEEIKNLRAQYKKLESIFQSARNRK